MKLLKSLFKILLLVILFFALFGFGYYFASTMHTHLSPEKLLLQEKSIIVYDNKNHKSQELSLEMKGQTSTIYEIPEFTAHAFTDTEDKRFFKHNGFDTRRIAKACLVNLRTHSYHEGASTISQQLIKNTHLTHNKTLKRKLQEWKLTQQLEKRYSKEEILERYLNLIYFGHNCFGIRSAAAFYFGKSPSDLDIADSAILAGLIRSPNNYSPFKNAQACQKRKKTVLGLMLKNGSITQAEYQSALHKPLPVNPQGKNQNVGYAHFVFDELSSIAEEYHFQLGGNIEIFTYFDPETQNVLELVASNHTQTDKTLLSSNVQTGGFTACVSTVGNIRRLPGSLLKPLFIYAPAMEQNVLTPATPILDEPIDYSGYKPKNYDGKYHGYTSARECLAQSLNVPAVKILESLGLANALEFASKMDLPVDKDDTSLALALGGMKNGYTLPQIVSAYSLFPRNGQYIQNRFISKIKINGLQVYAHNKKEKRVFSPETTQLTTDMLQTTAKNGTAKKLRTLPFPIAAKTGTAGGNNGNTDAYAISYTPDTVIGVWLGNSQGGFINYTGGGEPCNLLRRANELIHDIAIRRGNTDKAFPLSKNIVRVELDKRSYYDTHTLLLADERSPKEQRFMEIFKKETIPTKKDDSFSNPTIISPTLRYEHGKVYIQFDSRSPQFYRYKIERYDDTTHTTLYNGAFIKNFVDESIQDGKVYRYTVIPIFNEQAGKPIELPSVYTKRKEYILDTPWWEH